MVGETIALGVAVAWTATAVYFEDATKRMGTLQVNVFRLGVSMVLLAITVWIASGPFLNQIPIGAWGWLGLSGFIGYIIGDYCLFRSYKEIGSRFTQLFMTLSSPFAAITAYYILQENLSIRTWIGMLVTIGGIMLSIVSRPQKGTQQVHGSQSRLKIPLTGILLAIGASLGQGVGLVLSKMGMNALLHVEKPLSHWLLPFEATFVRSVIGFTVFLCILLFTRGKKGLKQIIADKFGLRQAILGTILGPYLGVAGSLMALQFAPAGVVSTLLALTPIMILFPARYYYHQRISWTEIIGAIISVLGVIIMLT